MEAGKELAAYIAALRLDPSDRLFIVAHSHGGNVALYALGQPGTERVEGITFLATPFMQFGPQNFPFAAFRLLPFAISNTVFVVVSSVLFASVEILGIPVLKQLSFSAFPALVVILTVGLGIPGVFAFLAGRVVRKMLPKTEAALAEIAELCEYYQPPAPQRQRVLILRNAGDEASAALESGRFVESLTTWVWGRLSWLSGRPGAILTALTTFMERHRWTWWILLPLLIVATVLVWKFPDTVSGPWVFVFGGAICAVLAVFGIQALLLTSILCFNVARFGLGPTLGRTALIRVTSEATPLGSWKVETFPSTGFAHGEIHEASQVADRIARWLLTEGRREPRESDA